MKFLFVQPCRVFPGIQHFQLGLFSLIAQLRAAGHSAEYMALEEQVPAGHINPAVDVIGIYTIECMLDEIKQFVATHRKHHIMLGGPTATIAPEICGEYDSLCIGDGEIGVVEYANKPSKTIQGFYFDSGAIKNPLRPRLSQQQLEHLVEPQRQCMQAVEDQYMAAGQRVTSIYATRGCPFSCTYCSNSHYNTLEGCKFKARTPEQVIHEIKTTIDLGGISSVTFEDDILTMDKEWFSKLCRLFRQNFPKLVFEMNTRVGCITKEQVREAVDSGCLTIRFGVESGSKFIRSYMGRDGIENEDMVALADWILDAGLNLYYCSIIGVPPETPSLFDETRALVDKIYKKTLALKRKATVILNTFYPLHGTPLGDKCYKEGWVKRNIQGVGAHVDYALDVPWMDREYVIRQQRQFRKDYTGMISIHQESIRDY